MTNRLNVEITPGATPIEFIESERWWSDLQKAYNLLCHDKPYKPADILYFSAVLISTHLKKVFIN